MRRFRVAIIEPSAIIAEGVATLAGRSGEFEVVYSGGDMRMLMERFAMVAPDVVIVGSQMVGANNQSLRVAYPELQSVTLALLSTTVCDEEVMRQFDGVVNIYDGQAQIIRKLHAAVEQGERRADAAQPRPGLAEALACIVLFLRCHGFTSLASGFMRPAYQLRGVA